MGGARKILVVNDDPATGERFEQVLSGKGHDVINVASGEEALWQLAQCRCDAVFTGIVLRGMSGLELAEEIHARKPRLPVVIITGHGSAAAQERAAAAGVTEFMHQPLSPELLADAAERVLIRSEPDTGPPLQTSATEVAPAQKKNQFLVRLKNIGLFILGPFLSLVYILTFPVIGLGMLIHMAYLAKEKSYAKTTSPHPVAPSETGVLKSIAMMLGMLLSGTFYGVFVPIMGIGLILWFGLRAWGKVGAEAIGPGQTQK